MSAFAPEKTNSMPILSNEKLKERLRILIQQGWIEIPTDSGYGGTGGPGKLLENLLGVAGGNDELPDSGRWELKYHSGKSLLTMFHKEASPRGHLEQLVQEFGWPDEQNRTSFRHTVAGVTGRGFYIDNDGQNICLRNNACPERCLASWKHDTIINAFVTKMRHLIVVKGERRKNLVKYRTAHFFWEPQSSSVIDAIIDGKILIDFDARTKSAWSSVLRNHGTKFRIRYEDLRVLYHERNVIG